MKHLFFDLDGTLTDPREGITKCLRYALTSLGRQCPDATFLERFIGLPLSHTFETLLNTTEASLVQSAVDAYRERFATVGLFENAVYPDIPWGLGVLQEANRQLYVVTSKPYIFAKQIIDHFELSSYFTSIYGSELNGQRTDKTHLIGHVLATAGLNPKEVVMIGDRVYDIVGAQNNHITSIGVTWGYGLRAELEAAGPQRIVSSVSELLAELLAELLDTLT